MSPAQIDALKFIAVAHRAALNTRREYEWKAFMSTLTLFVAAPAAAFAGRIGLHEHGLRSYSVYGAAIFVSAITSIYLAYIHHRNFQNKSIAHAAENEIIDGSGVRTVIDARDRVRNSGIFRRASLKFVHNYWSLIWQVVFLFSFGIASSYYVVAFQNSKLAEPQFSDAEIPYSCMYYSEFSD